MECYCGQLQPAIKSRCFPYASLDHYITETAQHTQIKLVYNLFSKLSLILPRGNISGSLSIPEYNTVVLLPPKRPNSPQKHLKSIAAALATRYHVCVMEVNACLKSCIIEEWGKAQRVASTEGDTFWASGLGVKHDDAQDASFVRASQHLKIESEDATTLILAEIHQCNINEA
ncbi:hypothetical protein H0H92_015066 [Tricholoma furcatifolium]|nr:hypothetical protein H0H92_015066 [Tricholoma furcatifolium]